MESKTVLVACECGCTILKISKDFWDGKADYSIEAFETSFYANQRGIFAEAWKRIKAAWFMLRGKEFRLYDISLTEESFHELTSVMVELLRVKEGK